MGLRPRVYPGYPYPPQVDYRWSVRDPRSTQFQQGRRIAPVSYPPFRHPQIQSAVHRKAKANRTMDYVPSPESFYPPEYNKSTFAASPNSLYMYDQERYDMQNTLNSGMFGQTCPATDMITLTTEPEFDLNPQYENSDSLEGFFNGAQSGTLMPAACKTPNLSISSNSCPEKQPGSQRVLGLLGVGRQEAVKMEGPTLAELNMDPYLMEDIDSIIGNEEPEDKPQALVPVKEIANDVRKQTTVQSVRPVETAQKQFTTLSRFNTASQSRPEMSQSAQSAAAPMSNLFGNRTQNVAVVPPIPVTTTIKTEPMDTYENSGKSCLHKMLSSPPQRPVLSPTQSQSSSPPGRQVMPVVGQTRAPPLGQQVKPESVEEKWKEIREFIDFPAEGTSSRKRKRHPSGGSAIMSDEEDFRSSHPGNFSDDDSDSDADSDFSDSPLEESLTDMAKKSKQYFWQYNVQAKGPKGTRLKLNINDNDPHHPSSFEDPVFDATSTSLVGIRHGGKARKGDGNEVTPNPRKLFQIGKQLYKLNRQINSFQISNDQPTSIRNKSRKEKNKLASRACRLKKKAQHEANKVKLTGLDSEQNEMLEVVRLIWPQLKERAQQQMKGIGPSPGAETLSNRLDAIIKAQQKMVIAGNTTDYVNEVIAKVEEGDPTGGLAIRVKVKK